MLLYWRFLSRKPKICQPPAECDPGCLSLPFQQLPCQQWRTPNLHTSSNIQIRGGILRESDRKNLELLQSPVDSSCDLTLLPASLLREQVSPSSQNCPNHRAIEKSIDQQTRNDLGWIDSPTTSALSLLISADSSSVPP